MPDANPYHALGLRCNPFATPDTLQVPAHRWFDVGYSTPPLAKHRLLVQVMGSHGAGKTSHLLHWRQQTGGEYYRCERSRHQWNWPPIGAIAYWDEAHRIPLPMLVARLWQAQWNQATIVAATHRNLSLIARSTGLSVRTITLSTLCAETLLRWTQQAIDVERLNPTVAPILKLSQDRAVNIVNAATGSWRAAARDLHIWAAQEARQRASL